MPGSDVVHKQNVLGSAAGVALLLFALVYRFAPEIKYRADPAHPVPVVNGKASAPMSSISPPIANPLATAPAASEPMGPPVSLAPQVVEPPPPKAIAALLKKADKAYADGHLLEPKDTGALAIYTQVLAVDKDNKSALAGMEKIHNDIFNQAVAALDRGDDTEATRLLAALDGLQHPADELAPLQARLLTLKQTAPLLNRAAELLKAGHATAPEGDSALDVYRQVVKLDVDNKLADQGLANIERGYLDRALAAAAQDDFAGADQVLADASSIRPGSHELLDTRTRIEGIRHQRAANVLAQANSALDSGNADLAELLSQKALGLSSDLGGIDEFKDRLRNARLYASFKPGQIVTDAFLDRSGHAPPLDVIPTGTFTMGSPASEEGHRSSEEPQRQVNIAVGFALGRDDVTVAEFRAFVDDTHYLTDAEKLGNSSVYDEESGRIIERRGVDWRSDYHGVGAAENLPVIHVSWNDAQAYAEWLTTRTGKKYRLPSEAEFEYALRAGTTTRYSWGDGNPTHVVANLTGDGERSPSHRSWSKSFPQYNDKFWGPAPVGSFAPNKFGLRDIDGNVSEWVDDCWHDNYTRAPVDSRAWINPGCAEHVVRGGSWGSAPDQVRSAFRATAPSATRSARVGIRVARDL